MDEIIRRLGRRIRELRIQRGFASQEAFADYLKMHRTFMGHLETGRKDFRLTTIIRVADALEVTLSDLFSGLESGKSPQAERSASRKRKGLTDERPVDRGRVLKEIQSLERTVSSLKSILSNQQLREP